MNLVHLIQNKIAKKQITEQTFESCS